MDDTQASFADGYSQADRLLAIDTPLGPDQVLLVSLDGEDELSRCFVYRIVIATRQPDDAVQSLLGMPVTLWLLNNSPELRRPIHGHVRRVVGQGVTPHGAGLYRLEVAPRLWFLTCTSDCRIFQDQTLPEIIQTIFNEQGLTDFEFRIVRADYPRVDYCVQYQETAHDFVSRLMEHLGLFYWHEHQAGRHLLVIADRNAATPRYEPAEQVEISPLSGFGELQSLAVDCSFRPGRWALNDYDFQSPTKRLRVDTPTTVSVPRMVNHEMYEYPGNFLDQDRGRWLSRRRIEQEEAQQRRVFGTGRAAGFDPGRRFKVAPPRGGGSGANYLLTEVRHRATDPGAETGGEAPSYANEFVAIPSEAPFRPERLTPKPFMRGAQTATVVGPPGENIHCDAYGRVRVQFHWDRRGQRDDRSSCWIRVSQSQAGSFYGSQVLPHVGHEVIVSFLEGDPDRPLITGNVPNALTMPPMVLPRDKDKTIQRDHGDNKIVMQGKAGEEHVSMMSPRAVNVFASGRSASPLSFGTSGTYRFFVNPVANNSTTDKDNKTTYFVPTTGSSGTGDSYDIPYFQDQDGLKELWKEWYGTVQSDIDAGANFSAKDGTWGTQDGTTDGSYLNWGSEGRINCLVLSNNNLWVYKNSNTWIRGDVNTEIHGNSTTEIGQPSADVAVKTTIWGSNNSIIGGANATSVAGDNVTSVFAGNQTFVGGLNLSVTLGANIALNVGETFTMNAILSQTLNLLSSITLNFGNSSTYNNFELDTTGTKVDTLMTRVQNISANMMNAGVKLVMDQTAIFEAALRLCSADLTIYS
jgi:type VI secretion system secreted protein VgrG